MVHAALEHEERAWARGRGVEYGEVLLVLAPQHLHVNLDAEEMFG